MIKQAHTYIKNWFVADIYHNERLLAAILWGIVTRDHSGRFEPGHYVCTSQIAGLDYLPFIVTANSIYGVSGNGTRIAVDSPAVGLLRQGFHYTELPSDHLLDEPKPIHVELN